MSIQRVDNDAEYYVISKYIRTNFDGEKETICTINSWPNKKETDRMLERLDHIAKTASYDHVSYKVLKAKDFEVIK